jgi:hypothetical protein
MTRPTYEELEKEVSKLRAKLSFGEDEDFTNDLKWRMPAPKELEKYEKRGVYVVRPAEMWGIMFAAPNPSTSDLAKLGRSLQAMGWVRSAQRGNLVFKLPVEEYKL